jgi:ABC-2 type transport system permease protein
VSNAQIVFRKELRELLGVRSSLLTGIAFALFFGGMYSLRLTGDMPLALDVTLGSLLFFLTTMIGAFLGYTFTSQIFLREKMDQVVETLLCSPVSLRGVWLGKTLAVTAFAHIMALGAGALTAIVTSARMHALVIPNAAVILYLVVVLPLVIACLVGALGFAQMLLGMKENRIIGFALFIPIFAGLYGLGYTSTGTLAIGWLHVWIVSVAAIAVLGVLAWCTRFLSRERIVTSLT